MKQQTIGTEIISSRVFDAPRERVFHAFDDLEQLAQWWGPEGFSNTFEEFDFRPGGIWRFVMHGPDGKDYPNSKEFLEVVKPERIRFRHTQPTHNFQMEMTYAPEGDKTRLTWRMTFEDPQSEKFVEFIKNANEQNFDRLAAHLSCSF